MTHFTVYRGRFAPTPSGPLHLGSLLTALASYLQAKRQRGEWLLRMDDLDTPRCVPGADSEILRQLEAHGLTWDGAIRYQSQHLAEYRDALDRLQTMDLIYACNCTRAVLKRDSRTGPDDPVYSGRCRQHPVEASHQALRIKTDEAELCFDDGGLGRQCRQVAQDIGDFIVRRADGFITYQLACTVDESAQHITEVVRGADLLGSTFRQILLQEKLGLPSPRYRHLPVLTDEHGRKLSKQNHAPPLSKTHAAENLAICLGLLGQKPPAELQLQSPTAIVAWAMRQWDSARVPSRLSPSFHGAAQQVLA